MNTRKYCYLCFEIMSAAVRILEYIFVTYITEIKIKTQQVKIRYSRLQSSLKICMYVKATSEPTQEIVYVFMRLKIQYP